MKCFDKTTKKDAHDKYKMLLSLYIDGEIKNNDLNKLFNHLKQCPDCKKYLDEIQKIRISVRQTKTDETFNLSYDWMIAKANTIKKVNYQKNFISYACAALFLFVLVATTPKIISNFNHANSLNTSIWPSFSDLDKETIVFYYSDYI